MVGLTSEEYDSAGMAFRSCGSVAHVRSLDCEMVLARRPYVLNNGFTCRWFLQASVQETLPELGISVLLLRTVPDLY